MVLVGKFMVHYDESSRTPGAYEGFHFRIPKQKAALLWTHRSVERGRGLLLFVVRVEASAPDVIRPCTEIHKICGSFLFFELAIIL